MIVIKFQGGLGNQMFQYALYKRLQKDGKDVQAEILDYAYAQPARRFQLLNFPKLDICFAHMIQSGQGTILMGPPEDSINDLTRYMDKVAYFHEEILDLNSGYLIGYWQSEKYFETVRSELLEAFSFPRLCEEGGVKTHAY